MERKGKVVTHLKEASVTPARVQITDLQHQEEVRQDQDEIDCRPLSFRGSGAMVEHDQQNSALVTSL